eukprot:3001483-Amphidinium_carterae.1
MVDLTNARAETRPCACATTLRFVTKSCHEHSVSATRFESEVCTASANLALDCGFQPQSDWRGHWQCIGLAGMVATIGT